MKTKKTVKVTNTNTYKIEIPYGDTVIPIGPNKTISVPIDLRVEIPGVIYE